VDGETFVVGDELKLEVIELPDMDYLYGFYITDTAQNECYSDFVTLSIKDGMISVKE
jgi:hypothetical protein